MGESIMAASNHEEKMGGIAASDRGLDVSVSFGRFENDSLSWEKWSSFSPNKYMEEVEKCATPGSVAKKKAYFEAHYKKISARKAEQMGQEKQMEHESLGSNDQNGGDRIGKACGTNFEFDISNSQTCFAQGTNQETKLDELDTGHADKPNEDAATNIKGQSLSVERVEEELGSGLDGPTLNKPEEADVVKEGETLSMESREMNELPKNLDKQKESIPVVEEENLKLDHPKESQKTSTMSELRDMTRIKKKPASPVAKSPQVSTPAKSRQVSTPAKSRQVSTPKVSKTVPTSSALSTSRPSTKKVTSSSPKSKNPSLGDRKKVAPKSLHMSLSMDTSNSDPAAIMPTSLTTTTKSLIMEKMKDKDIVKRAFKTFQNNFNQLKGSAEEKSLAAKQMPTRGIEVKVSSSVTPRKDNAGSLRTLSMDKKTAKASPSSFGLKNDERAEKRKEFSKKLEEKSKSKEAETTHLRTKSKEERGAEIRKLRESPNFKATPMPGFYRRQKGPLDKEGSKTLET